MSKLTYTNRAVWCRRCGAKGTCPVCKGSKLPSTKIQYPAPQPTQCGDCDGTGLCITCKGAGEYHRARQLVASTVTEPGPGNEICPDCHGSRWCGECDGGGRSFEDGNVCPVCTHDDNYAAGICCICEGKGEIPLDFGKPGTKQKR